MKATTVGTSPRNTGDASLRSVSFGSVTVQVSEPPESVRQANIKAGQVALERSKGALQKAGIKIPRQKGVPLYFGCEDKPGWMERELNGQKTLGKFVGGRFRAMKPRPTSVKPSSKA